jgi:hypothetical protein
MAPAMATVRVSNLLVQGGVVDVGGCPHLHLYHLGRLPSLNRYSSWYVTHGPKRNKVAFDAVVAVVLRYSF